MLQQVVLQKHGTWASFPAVTLLSIWQVTEELNLELRKLGDSITGLAKKGFPVPTAVKKRSAT